MHPPELLVRNASEVVTPLGRTAARGRDLGRLRRVERGAVLARGGTIVAVGPENEVVRQAGTGCLEIDAQGHAVLPGFIDPHTHAVFGSPRSAEYALRLEGKSYVEIAAAGGGIHASVKEVREATADDLLSRSRVRLERMLGCGTTTLEIKSGYGLTLQDEIKMLEVGRRLAGSVPQEVVLTFLGAHEVPIEFRGRRDAYVHHVVEDMLPAVAGRAEFNDVFCEPSVFTLAESERILRAGEALGMRPKLHADELEPYGAAELACRLGAVSADHLMFVSENGMRTLGESPTVAVLLPATSFGLASRVYAPARALVEAGAALALASDFNPGSSYCEDMQVVWSLACSMLRLTPAEGLVAATLNAAAALGRADRIGSLETGKRCDLVVTGVRDYREVPHHFGGNDVRQVVCDGRLVWTDPSLRGSAPEAGEV
jgi:imidazolonepropionase